VTHRKYDSAIIGLGQTGRRALAHRPAGPIVVEF
jgi:hypothetical protein